MMPAEPTNSELPRATIKQKTLAYFGVGTDDLLATTKRPSRVRLVIAFVVFLAVGCTLCALGHASVGAILITVDVVSGCQAWYQRRRPTHRP
jgi:hypothetical protein